MEAAGFFERELPSLRCDTALVLEMLISDCVCNAIGEDWRVHGRNRKVALIGIQLAMQRKST